MKPKKILMRLLLIGVVGSLLTGISCMESDDDPTYLYYSYNNKTAYQISIKVYKDKNEYVIDMKSNDAVVQTTVFGMNGVRPQDDSVVESDSVCIFLPALNKELWYKGPRRTTVDKTASSPYILENYTEKKISERKTRRSYYFTQTHIDLAQPINQQPE